MDSNDVCDPFTDVDIYGFDWNVSKAIGWIAMKFHTDIHIPLRMNWNNFGDPDFSSSTIIWSKFH